LHFNHFRHGFFQDTDEFLLFLFQVLDGVVSSFEETILATISCKDLPCDSLFNLSSVDVKTTLTCTSCRGQSVMQNVFRTLHLGISSLDEETVRSNLKFSHESQDLQTLLDAHFATDEAVDGDSVCGPCGARREVILLLAFTTIHVSVEDQKRANIDSSTFHRHFTEGSFLTDDE
jgi:uncharacterized UBP type Zn finger protein